MYRTEKTSWLKHIDFILWDLVCVQLAYLLAYAIRHPGRFAYSNRIYLQLGLYIFLIQLCISVFSKSYEGILRRGFLLELQWTIISVSVLTLLVLVLLFLVKWSDDFSRTVILMTWFGSIILIYAERNLWKRFIRKRMRNKNLLRRLVIVANAAEAEILIRQIEKYRYKDFFISGIVLLDGGRQTGEKIHGIPVVASNESEAVLYLENDVVDRVFISGRREDPLVQKIFYLCEMQGIPIHFNVGHIFHAENKPIVENFCGQAVVTYSVNTVAYSQLILKRLIDIIGGLIGLILTGILTIILAPIIFIQSPGPIFFSQERVGQNGRIFKIYKFRSMYPDAEKCLKELKKNNKMQGPMFKMDNDPRIIPIGRFIRKTSLDEFPQFWNVLKGDLSLVGTRPPVVSEYESYKPEYKIRLSFKPGLTGLWQVSGRSDIVDFEEIVNLDKQYISDWSLGLDFKIMIKTLKIMFTGKGAV